MNLLLKSVKIIQPGGQTGKATDILIVNGKIEKIGKDIPAAKGAEIIEGNGAYVSLGWLDMKANFRDPGNEVKEGIATGLDAAAAGGFTGVVLMPSTEPPIQTKSAIEYLRNRANNHLVDIFPAGALSVNREGQDITEMFDMKSAGAVAFTDDRRPVADSGLLLRALQYAKNAGSFIISYADDKNISGKGQVNESISSTMAGLKGMPSFAEELMINRDLKICEYTGGKIHFSTISTAAAVEMIRKAKKKGLPVTAEVCAHQLYFDDSVILDYDTNYKVKPPFRLKSDIKALKQGIADGTIDVICSDHSPEDAESKIVEFEFAAYGISGIETAFAASITACGNTVELATLIDAWSARPRAILGLPAGKIEEGAIANLTLFDPEEEWIPAKENMKTKGINNPFVGIKLKGKPIAVINNNQFRYCRDAVKSASKK